MGQSLLFLGIGLFLVGCLVSCLVSCVERKLVIRSEPPGGVVVLDNKIIGVTPVTVPFTFYGCRQVEVRWDPFLAEMDPFPTAKEVRHLYPPWYQYVPLDFLVEILWPFTITDERFFDFDLYPRQEEGAKPSAGKSEGSVDPVDAVIRRAEATRARALVDKEEGP